MINIRRVHVPLFEIATGPAIPFPQIKQRRYGLLDRMQDRIQAESTEDPSNYVIPSRKDIEVLPADEPGMRIGWVAHEILGMSVVNNYCLLPWYRRILRRRFWSFLWK